MTMIYGDCVEEQLRKAMDVNADLLAALESAQAALAVLASEIGGYDDKLDTLAESAAEEAIQARATILKATE